MVGCSVTTLLLAGFGGTVAGVVLTYWHQHRKGQRARAQAVAAARRRKVAVPAGRVER